MAVGNFMFCNISWLQILRHCYQSLLTAYNFLLLNQTQVMHHNINIYIYVYVDSLPRGYINGIYAHRYIINQSLLQPTCTNP